MSKRAVCRLSIVSQQRCERREGVEVERKKGKKKKRERRKGKKTTTTKKKKQPANLAIMREYRTVQIYTMAVMQ